MGCQVGLNLDVSGVESFIKARMGKIIDMGGCVGPITTFIVEPFVPHAQEYYLCIQSKRLGSDISFSEAGGVEIEENWDKVCLTLLSPTIDSGANHCPTLARLGGKSSLPKSF